ncbi:MAG: YitT family protein [Bacteroidia bacterium]|nr:YitT family protein [Bacteroidia bacterium]
MISNYFMQIRSYTVMIIGLALYAFGVTAFLIPLKIAAGGVTGISMLVYYATGFGTGYTYFLINIFLVLIAIKVLGANFGMKTIFSMTIIAIMLNIMQRYVNEPILKDMFLSSVLSGILGGIGIGLIFNEGGSTGGTDIIAMIINKYRNISPGRIIMYCDVLIIASSYLVLHSVEKLVYGYVSMWVVAYSIDAFLTGAQQSVQIFIISSEYEAIANSINHESRRGLTMFDATGWYTQKGVKVIMTVVRKRESPDIFRKIKALDPNAFISLNSVMGVYGKGFDKLKY